MTQNRAVRGVLVDVDGTLIDSNDAHTHAWLQAMSENGYDDVPFEKVRPLIGMGGDKVLPETIGVDKDRMMAKRSARAAKRSLRRAISPLSTLFLIR